MNKLNSTITRLFCPDPLLFWAYMLPILYWTYLTLSTNFVLVFDSEGYYSLGHLFYDPGQWTGYFRTGPNREPLYPLLIAASMMAGKWLGVSYAYPLKIFSFGFLAATMIILQKILRLLNANRWVVATTIFYTGLSPILINSALCLYSEIVSLPWLVGEVLMSVYFLRSLRASAPANFSAAIGLGACLLGFTCVKGIGEALAPLFLFWLIAYSWRKSDLQLLDFWRRSKIKILIVLFAFYVPLLSYKFLNYTFNGQFVLTNRADMSLYGTLNQRAQTPLTTDNLLVRFLNAPTTYPLCSRFFPDSKCAYWSISASDETFLHRQDQLDKQHYSSSQKERLLHQSIYYAIMSHPFIQTIYLLQEGLKMFFWETSQGAFVVYPTWLENLFNAPGVIVFMSLGAGCLCLTGFIVAGVLLKDELILITFVLTFLLILLFSFTNIIPRYAIIAAPLEILINAACLSMLVTKKS